MMISEVEKRPIVSAARRKNFAKKSSCSGPHGVCLAELYG
jgi:hypothetical protein